MTQSSITAACIAEMVANMSEHWFVICRVKEETIGIIASDSGCAAVLASRRLQLLPGTFVAGKISRNICNPSRVRTDAPSHAENECFPRGDSSYNEMRIVSHDSTAHWCARQVLSPFPQCLRQLSVTNRRQRTSVGVGVNRRNAWSTILNVALDTLVILKFPLESRWGMIGAVMGKQGPDYVRSSCSNLRTGPRPDPGGVHGVLQLFRPVLGHRHALPAT